MVSAFARRFKTNKSLEEDGTWVDIGDDISLKIRRFNSEKSQEVRRRLEKPYAHMTRQGRALPTKTNEEITKKQIIEVILVDWKGITDDNGEVIPYSLENAKKLLETKDFMDEVARLSLNEQLFKDEALKEDEGN